MSPMQRGYADGPFGQIHYCDSGGEGAALVLLHQAPLSSRQFDRVYPIFAEREIRVIGIDIPGLGASDPVGGLPTIELYSEVVPCVLDHLQIQAAHLCGHHTGAMLCVDVSLRWPERVLTLTLSGPAPLTPEEQREFIDTIVAKERAYQPVDDGSHLQELWARRITYLPPSEDRAALCTACVLQPIMALAPFWHGHHAAFSYDMTRALEQVTHPTQVIANTGDMIFHLAERTMGMRPDFHYVEIEGGGVDPTDLEPELWSDAVCDFLNQATSR